MLGHLSVTDFESSAKHVLGLSCVISWVFKKSILYSASSGNRAKEIMTAQEPFMQVLNCFWDSTNNCARAQKRFAIALAQKVLQQWKTRQYLWLGVSCCTSLGIRQPRFNCGCKNLGASKNIFPVATDFKFSNAIQRSNQHESCSTEIACGSYKN